MKKTLVLAIVAGMLLSLTGTAIAESITVENFSFEEPCTVKLYNWESVPDWDSDTVADNSGVDTEDSGFVVTDGQWFGYLWNADPSVYNLTDHTISAGELLILTVDASKGYTSGNNGPLFKMTLYYDNAGSRVPVSSHTFAMHGTDDHIIQDEYSITFTADLTPASIGKKIGIELQNTASPELTSWLLMDNVRLEKSLVSNPGPADHATFVAVTTNLSWTLDPSVDKCDVYFGTDPCVTANPKVIDGVMQTSYNPPGNLDPEMIYFWRVDTYVGETLHEGDKIEWEFTTAPDGTPEEDVYYVNGDYGDNSNPGTINEPWQTINKANSTLQAGDTVYIRAGTYIDDQVIPSGSGTLYNHITYQNYNNEDVIILDNDSGSECPLKINGKSYIRVIGLKFRRPSYRWGWILDSDHIYIEDCVFDEVRENIASMSYRAYRVENSSQIYHKNCLWTMENQTSDNGCDMVEICELHHAKFEQCVFGNATHVCLTGSGGDTETAYIVIRDCLFKSEWHSQLSVGNAGTTTTHWLVEGTVIRNSGKSRHLDPSITTRPQVINPAIYCNADKFIIRKNSLYHNEANLNLRPQTYENIPMNVWFYNNTVYDATFNPYLRETLSRPAGTFIYAESGSSANPDFPIVHDVFILNNIFWKSTGDYVNRDFYIANVYGGIAPYDNIIKYNLFGDPCKTIQGFWSPHYVKTVEWLEDYESQWINDTHILGQDPLFIDPDAGTPDFTLQASSPAIDHGTWLTTITSNTANNQTSITLEDAIPFYSGAGAPWLIEGETGDTIKTENGQITTIQSIDYDTNTITVSPAIDIVNGEGVALDYAGSAPDLGAFEFTGVACFPIVQAGWSLVYVDSEELVEDGGYPAEKSFDDDPDTFWSTDWDISNIPPHEIQIDLGGFYDICGFRYLPRQDDGPGDENGMIKDYEFYVSNNTDDWGTAVASGIWTAGKAEKRVSFDGKLGKFVRLIALSEVNGNEWTTMAELNVLAVQPDSDINNDGKVNIEDFAIMATWWDDEDACSPPDWCEGADFDMSGTVDMLDLTYFVENWLRQVW